MGSDARWRVDPPRVRCSKHKLKGVDMNLYAIRRRDFWGTPEELQATATKSAQVGDEMADDVRWIRTYVVQEESGRLGTVCIYQGTHPEKVREQAERSGMPADEISLVLDTVIVNTDPIAVPPGAGSEPHGRARPPATAGIHLGRAARSPGRESAPLAKSTEPPPEVLQIDDRALA